MPIPDYQTLMLLLLKAAGDGQEHRTSDAADRLAHDFKLTKRNGSSFCPAASKRRLPIVSLGRKRISFKRLYSTPPSGSFQDHRPRAFTFPASSEEAEAPLSPVSF
jgi:restriction endonuclease Mrr